MIFGNYFIFVCSVIIFSKGYGLKVEVLKPVNNSTVEAGLIITPGADITGQAYRPLAEAIQKASGVKLWVALLEDFPFNVPNPIQLDTGVNEAIEKMGIANGNVFLAGHSLGGVFVGDYGLKNYKKLRGVLLFASYLTRGHKLQDYPLPVLHISGDLDGLTRITRIVDTFEELMDDMKTVGHKTMYHTPVVVMEGINHGHFASGTMPPNVKSHDLEAEMSYDSAHTIIAGHVGAFLVMSLQQPTTQVTEAEVALNKSFDGTKMITQPLSAVKSWDVMNGNTNDTTIRAQQIIIGTKLAQHTKVEDTHKSEEEIVFNEPSAKLDGINHAQIQTFSHVSMPFNPEDVSENPQTPTEIQSKMVTKQDLMILLPNVTADSSNNTCQQVNQLTYETVIKLASVRAQQRYKSHGSPAITFHPDIQVPFTTEWMTSDLKLEYGSHGELDVTSYAYVILPKPESGFERLMPSFGRKRKVTYSQGYYFCKLLSPYRALEWFYIDSLKPST